MKKAISLFLALSLTFSLCIGLISCGNSNSPSDNNPSANTPSGNNPSANTPGGNNSKPFSVDLAGYVANIGNATALGISKNAKSGVSAVSAYGKSNSGIQLLSCSTLASDKNSENKNYIVMSTTEYGANAPETDGDGLTKVTFTKTVTENVTAEVTGTKVIKAHKDGLSIHAVEGFTYSVYEGDTLVYSEVRDNDENDCNSKKGAILLGDLTDKVDYTVKYSGIGVETTVTQDDINGEIDKPYVMGNYTFISFVPLGTSQRPADNELSYDASGIATYDKAGYFSSEVRQSFVIDNATGYVYQIKDTSIEKIENNLIIISGKIFDIRITENDELQFYTVVQNETLTISNYYKDIYGNKYIYNDYLDAYDENNQTVYYTNSLEYLFSSDGIVIHRDCDKYGNYTASVKKILQNFEEIEIKDTDVFYFDEYNLIEEGWLYLTYYYGNYKRINVSTLDEEYCQQNEPIGSHVSLVNCKTMVVFWNGNLYYGDVWGDNAVYPNGVTNGLCEENLILLIDGVVRSDNSIFDDSFEYWRFRKTTLTETIFYKVIVGEDGYPEIVSENYVAPEENVITLQPINK